MSPPKAGKHHHYTKGFHDLLGGFGVQIDGCDEEKTLRSMGTASLLVAELQHTSARKTATCDFARQMEGAKEVKCSEFADEMIKNLG